MLTAKTFIIFIQILFCSSLKADYIPAVLYLVLVSLCYNQKASFCVDPRPPALTSNEHSGRNGIQREAHIPICLPKGTESKVPAQFAPMQLKWTDNTWNLDLFFFSFTRSWLFCCLTSGQAVMLKPLSIHYMVFGSVTVCVVTVSFPQPST